MMKVVYFSPYDLLRPRTNQVSDVRFCEAFAENACKVDLIVPQVKRKDNLPAENILTYYGVNQPIKVNFLSPIFKQENLGRATYLRLSFMCLKKLLQIDKTDERIYIFSRSEVLLLFSLLHKKIFRKKNWHIVPWLHELKKGKIHRFIYRNTDIILATNRKIVEDLNKLISSPHLSFITLNPISEQQANTILTKQQARELIGYSSDKKLIVYTGKLYINQPEIDYLIQAAKRLPDYQFIFTGGKPEVLVHYQRQFQVEGINNIELTGYLPDYRSVRNYQFAADILVSYYTEKEHDVRYNLPNKLAEYMLTKNPVITPFYPATDDLLTPELAFEVEAENAEKLADTIKKVLENETKMKQIGEQAYQFCIAHTYKKQIEEFLGFIRNL